MAETILQSRRGNPVGAGIHAETFETGDAGVVIETPTDDGKFRFIKAFGHFDAAIAEDLTIKLGSRHGTEYETLILTVSAGATDFYFVADGNDIYGAGDLVKVETANSGGATFGIVIVRELLEPQV